MRASAREAPRLATGKRAGQLVRAGWLALGNGRLCVCVFLMSVMPVVSVTRGAYESCFSLYVPCV